MYNLLCEKRDGVVFLDGDDLRAVFGNDLGYTAQDRKMSAMRNARLCGLLAGQGLVVVCCTISMFHDVRAYNRGNLAGYREVYVQAPKEVLIARNQKGLYSGVMDQTTRHVAGMDLTVEEPVTPDLVLYNDGSRTPEELAEQILLHWS